MKGYRAKRLTKEFPAKEWKITTLNDFLKHLRQKLECIVHLLNLNVSFETTCVYMTLCVIKRHAHALSEANRITRLTRAKQLLRKFPEHAVDFVCLQ